mmetsp:Transcript_22056/g.41552  ORF Transcript_22056/g.41552 Transcript_22056/m.41552 type:complete len:494 (+) Transcript_22056:72-1553(+)
MMPAFGVAAFLVVGAQGAALSLSDRIQMGECVDSTTAPASLFPDSFRLGDIPSTGVTAAEPAVTAAGLMTITYANHFKVITEKLSKEQYVLTQCGMNEPTAQEVDVVVPLETGYQRKFFTIPLQRVIPDTTIGLSMLEALGVQDRVSHVSEFATGACWQKALTCAQPLEGSWNGNATIREAQLTSVDAVFMDCSGDCEALRARSNAVHFPAAKDNGNLHSAEYVKFLAAFFNLEDVASQAFDQAVASYPPIPESANAPLVAWAQYNSWTSRWEVNMASFRVQMTEAAGGRMLSGTDLEQHGFGSADAVFGNPAAGKVYYLSVNESEAGDKEAKATTLMTALADVDWLVDEFWYATPSDYKFTNFLTNFHLESTSQLKFVKDRQVLRYDGTLSSSDGWDWLESRLARPDWAVNGLARYLQGNTAKTQMYFRNVATGEMPRIVSAAECTEMLPVCDATASEEAIKSPAAAATDLSGAGSYAFAVVPSLLALMQLQ